MVGQVGVDGDVEEGHLGVGPSSWVPIQLTQNPTKSQVWKGYLHASIAKKGSLSIIFLVHEFGRNFGRFPGGFLAIKLHPVG